MSSEDFEMAPMVSDFKSHDEKAAEKFNQLASLNLNNKAESKNGLSYVSWANAWKAFKEVYPTATYRIINNPRTDLPYFIDPALGIMVFTEVSADGLTYPMWLPVMDGANKAMKTEAYTYQVWDKFKKTYVEKKVEAATMFDINKTLMRCLVKNLSMFGLALYIYAGEDMPEEAETTDETTGQQPKPRKHTRTSDPYAGIKAAINATTSTQELLQLYQQHEAEIKGHPEILSLLTQRKGQLLNAA